MKKIFKYTALIAALVLAVTACQKELETAQYSDTAVTLASFGPNPVMRGAQLRFFGSNLDKIVKVEVPGVDPITQIEVVKSGKNSEIRVELPVEGPEVGYVTLYTSNNQKFTTKSEVTYTEPIVFDGFEAAQPALPGDVVTLRGDYMNLVKAVIFTGGEEVEVEEDATRHEAKVVVPANAQTGIIILSDKGQVENLFYSKNELVIGEPSVRSITAPRWKAGQTVTITGAHLEMIEKVSFEGVVVEDFALAADKTKITLDIPQTAKSGNVSAVSFSGIEYGTVEVEMVVPTNLAAAPAPVKAGGELTISGKDLDLVTGVDFDGAAGADFVYEDDAITVTVPAKAKEGNVTLNMANGDAVTVGITLVTPTITDVSPLELYAGDDELIVVKGTDLDLIVKATLGGKEVEIAAQGETEISLKTLPSSVGGNVALTLENGTVVTSEQEVTLNYHALVIVTDRPDAQHIGQEVVLRGENFNLVETIYIGEAKVTQYSIRSDSEIRFLMPWNKIGSYEMSFHLYNGDVETQATPIQVLLEQAFTTIWEGSEHLAWSGMTELSWGGFDWSTVKAGTTLIAYFTLDEDQDYWQVRFANGSWSALPSTATLAADGNIPMTEGQTYYSVTLTAADLDALVNEGGLVMTGTNYTLTKLVLCADIPQEKTIWKGEEVLAAWENHDSYGNDQNWVDAGVYAGAQVKIYFTVNDEDWAIQLFGPHWEGGLMVAPDGGQKFDPDNSPNAATDGYVSFTMTEEYLPWFATAQGWGGIIILQGQGCTVTEITML